MAGVVFYVVGRPSHRVTGADLCAADVAHGGVMDQGHFGCSAISASVLTVSSKILSMSKRVPASSPFSPDLLDSVLCGGAGCVFTQVQFYVVVMTTGWVVKSDGISPPLRQPRQFIR